MEARNPRSQVPEAGVRPQAPGWVRIFQRSSMLEMVRVFYLLCGTGEVHISEASLWGLQHLPNPQAYKLHKRNS